VFLEGVFRPIERWIEGSRSERMRRNAGPWTWDKLWRKALKHSLDVLLAFIVAHIIVSYFVSLPALYGMVMGDPSAHPAAFVWAIGLTSVLYFDFSWFREQTCLIVCPYGRLQSVLTDRDTLVIGYDVKRGEPRGKARAEGVGDCVDCGRCQVVCPTGIDIRNGLQLDCVGCARCVDACDEVMVKLKRPKGLVRYDSLKGLANEPRRVLRPRVYLYAGFGLAGLLALSLALGRSSDFEANLMRLRSLPFVVEGARVRNAFELHLVNKRAGEVEFELDGVQAAGLEYAIAMPRVKLKALESRSVPIFVSFPRGPVAGRKAAVKVSIDGKEQRTVSVPLVGPAR
jgi:cytochrome c oxidase accessory protein FixG